MHTNIKGPQGPQDSAATTVTLHLSCRPLSTLKAAQHAAPGRHCAGAGPLFQSGLAVPPPASAATSPATPSSVPLSCCSPYPVPLVHPHSGQQGALGLENSTRQSLAVKLHPFEPVPHADPVDGAVAALSAQPVSFGGPPARAHAALQSQPAWLREARHPGFWPPCCLRARGALQCLAAAVRKAR